MNDSAKKTIAALTAAVVVLTVLLGGATAAAVIFAVQRNDATAWFYVDGELYRTVTAKDGKVDCPDVPAVSDTVFDGWYADADHSGSRVSFPAGKYRCLGNTIQQDSCQEPLRLRRPHIFGRIL